MHDPKGMNCVMVPIQTESRLRFIARLDEGAPEVRLELAVRVRASSMRVQVYSALNIL
jgi:hypothetical protein